jgi:hypothetical protein
MPRTLRVSNDDGRAGRRKKGSLSKVRNRRTKAGNRDKSNVNNLEALETISTEEAVKLVKAHLDLIQLARRYDLMKDELMSKRNSKLTSKFLDTEVELLIAAVEYSRLYN